MRTISRIHIKAICKQPLPLGHSTKIFYEQIEKMPVLKIITNVARAKLPENILQDTSVMFEKVIGRPLQV